VERALAFSGGTYAISWKNPREMLLFPDKELQNSTQYNLVIRKVAQDTNGNNLIMDYILNFIVGDDFVKPEVSAIVIDGYNNSNAYPYVGSEYKRPNIRIFFTKSMQVDKTSQSIQIGELDGVWSWKNNNRELVIIPKSDLEYGKRYQVIIGSKAEDISGNVLKEEKSISFYAGLDFTQPEVVSLQVQNNSGQWVELLDNYTVALDISPVTKVAIVFSKAMNRISVKENLSLNPVTVWKEYVWDSFQMGARSYERLEVIPAENSYLTNASLYQIVLDNKTSDSLGNKLYQDLTRKFIVGKAKIPTLKIIQIRDIQGQVHDLLNSGFEVKNSPETPFITFVFSEAMNQEKTLGAINIRDAYWHGSFDTEGKILSVQIRNPLSYGKKYFITIDSSALSLDSLNLSQSSEASFIVGQDDQASFLKVKALTFLSDGVPLNTASLPVLFQIRIELGFDDPFLLFELDTLELMKKVSISPDFTALSSNEVTYNHLTNTIDINLEKPFTPGKNYTIKLGKGITAKLTNGYHIPLYEDFYHSFFIKEEKRFCILNWRITHADKANAQMQTDFIHSADGVSCGEKMVGGKLLYPFFDGKELVMTGLIEFSDNLDLNKDLNAPFYLTEIREKGSPSLTFFVSPFFENQGTKTRKLFYKIRNFAAFSPVGEDKIKSMIYLKLNGSSAGLASEKQLYLDESTNFSFGMEY
jgi:hypothetical protein